jgi:Na+-translocating ferredoxin:NAD+ oxidoreductase RnfE subunit
MKPHFTIATQLALAGLCVALALEGIQFNSVALAVATVKTLVRQNLALCRPSRRAAACSVEIRGA